ncbi:MAG TPA: GDSL-type esterase/lipase family protein, partial [Thermoanaerobaculia bacterium]|nr:GDSL-type esterase/lipase family protein [Thermoanaerobaculia bacterium]
ASKHGLHVLDVEMWRYARLVKRPSQRPGLVEEHRPGAEALLMGARVRIDERGFRHADPATEARRRPGERVVAALGDSLTFGWGVDEADTWPDQLERLLRRRCPDGGATVLNAGIGNSNTGMHRARYEELVRPLRPDWVILGWFINDAEPAPVPSENPLLWRSALAGLFSTRWRQGAEVHLRDFRAYYGGLYRGDQPGWRAARQALRALGARLRQDGAAATLLLLPELHEPRAFVSFAEIYGQVAKEAHAAGFEVIDSSPAFPPGAGDRFWVSPTDAHPNAAAHRIFAVAAARSRHACGRSQYRRGARRISFSDRARRAAPPSARRRSPGSGRRRCR